METADGGLWPVKSRRVTSGTFLSQASEGPLLSLCNPAVARLWRLVISLEVCERLRDGGDSASMQRPDICQEFVGLQEESCYVNNLFLVCVALVMCCRVIHVHVLGF